VRGRASELPKNLLQHSLRFLQHLIVPEAQHLDPLLGQPGGPSFIRLPLIGVIMLPAVQLHRELFVVAVKIDNKVADGVLAAEFAPG
jgi:hypothetical protein